MGMRQKKYGFTFTLDDIINSIAADSIVGINKPSLYSLLIDLPTYG